jgi:beta-propeller repeat-containing protein
MAMVTIKARPVGSSDRNCLTLLAALVLSLVICECSPSPDPGAGGARGSASTPPSARRDSNDGDFAITDSKRYHLTKVSDDEVAPADGSAETGNVISKPQLPYSTLLGGSGYIVVQSQVIAGVDEVWGNAVDSAGRIYVTGYTESTNFPVTGNAFQGTNVAATYGDPNAFISIIDPSQPPDAQLVYSTFLGGTGIHCNNVKSCSQQDGDFGFGVALGPNGLIYVAGETYSGDFPVTTGAFQTVNKGFGKNYVPPASSAFLSVIDPTAPPASQLVYSTYLGGSGIQSAGGDRAYGLAVDSNGLAYVVGLANSTDFPVTANAFHTTNLGFSTNDTHIGPNGFLSIVNPFKQGKDSLVYSSYLGGSFEPRIPDSGDFVQAVAVDASGLVYLTGGASSGNFPVTVGAFQKSLGSVPGNASQPVLDGFLTVLNPAKAAPSQLVYSTYLGGSNYDTENKIVVDANGSVYVAGTTCLNGLEATDDFPVTANAFQTVFAHPEQGGCRAIMSELNPKSPGRNSLVYSTYLGGGLGQTLDGFNAGAQDEAHGLAVDGSGRVYLTGRTLDGNFPVTSNALQPANAGIFNVFLTVLDPSLKGSTGLVYSTYLGDLGGDCGNAVVLGSQGLVYLGGFGAGFFATPSENWPVTSNAFEQLRPAVSPSPAPGSTYGTESGVVAVLNLSLPTPTPTASPKATPTKTPHATPTPRPTATPRITPRATPTSSPTANKTATPAPRPTLRL